MADDTEVIDQPPVRPVLPPSSGYTYSTQGPGDFSTTRMMGGPGGVQVPVPVNAQNFAAVQGAPGPVADPQTEMLRNVFNKLPVEQAIKAVQAAHMYQGQRLYQRMLSEGKTSAEALTVAGPLLFGGGINPTELAKFAAIGQKPQMTPYQQASVELRRRQLEQQANKPTEKPLTEAQKIDFAIKAQNMMKPGSQELPTDPSYQSRTNQAQSILDRLNPPAPRKGVVFKDKTSGKTFRYVGRSKDPKTDKNPDNWIEE